VILSDEGIALFERLTAGRASSDLIFMRDDGEPWRESNQKQRMKDACENGRIDPIGFHGLRHTFISHAVMAGTPYGVISKSVGASVAEIIRTYAHLLEDHEKQAMRAGALKLGALDDAGNVVRLGKRG
jgi:integrase